MYEFLLYLWEHKYVTEAELAKAVTKAWIDEIQKSKIKAVPQGTEGGLSMKETLISLWKQRKVTEAELNKAIAKRWITEVEKQEIMNIPQDPIL